MKGWEVFIALFLLGIFIFLVYFLSKVGLVTTIAKIVESLMIKFGDKTINFIKEITHNLIQGG